MKKTLTIFFFLATLQTAVAQPNLPPQEADSLFAVWNDNDQPDTNRLKAMHKIAWTGYLFTKPDSAFYFTQLRYDLAKEKGLKKYMASALHTQGVSFYVKGDYDKAMDYYSKSFKIQEEIGNKKGMASSFINIGVIYRMQGDYNKATDYYSKSLKIYEELGDKKGIASSFNNIGGIYFKQGDYDQTIHYFSKSLQIREELGDKKGMADSYNNIGAIYKEQDNYNKAIDYHSKSLKIKDEIGDKNGMATSFNNIGVVYLEQGNYHNAIDYYSKSLRIQEEIGDKNGIASSLSNIGVIYKIQDNYHAAIDYYSKSLKIKEEIGDKNGMATILNNIGIIYKVQVDYDNAIDYFSKSLTIREEIGNRKGIAACYGNIGVVYQEQGEYDKAMDYFSKSLKIKEELGDKNGIANTLINIGNTYSEQGNYRQALGFSNRSLIIAQEIGAIMPTKGAANSLYQTNKKLGRYQDALQMYELFIETRDSIESEANQKAVIRQEYKYAYEKQAAADSVKNAEAAKVQNALLTAEKAEKKRLKSESKRQKLENQNQQQQAYFLYGGLALALLFGGFIFNRFRVTQKQKGIIETQKTEVEQQKEKVDEAYEQLEEKNTEILDSINYAKRIQSAILPPHKLVKEYLQNSFILYKPKDIVAGDFYWMHCQPAGGEAVGDTVLFAAADCTGHGVPGAMVSVVCHNAMNRAVREFGLTDPGRILDKTREIVIQEFEKSEDEVKDGMDIALCSLNGNTLLYAGANNPLWIVRTNEVLETKATKQPIGQVDNPQPFTTHTFELQPNDVFYIFSDGYVDQFGGERGKKFKAKALRELLLSIQDQSMNKQREIINQAFENWRGDLEQVDDVCVIGVKIL